jgi:hypothetical protein
MDKLQELKNTVQNWIYWSTKTHYYELSLKEVENIAWLIKEYEKLKNPPIWKNDGEL